MDVALFYLEPSQAYFDLFEVYSTAALKMFTWASEKAQQTAKL